MPNDKTTLVTYRLRTGPDVDLEGYLFADEKHARRWLSQPLARNAEYYLEKVEISGDDATCPYCQGSGWQPRVFKVLGRMTAEEFLNG